MKKINFSYSLKNFVIKSYVKFLGQLEKKDGKTKKRRREREKKRERKRKREREKLLERK